MRSFSATIALFALLNGGVQLSAGDSAPPRPSFNVVAKICQGDPLGSVEEGDVKVVAGLSGTTVSNSPGGWRILQKDVVNVEDEQIVLGCVMYTNFEPAGQGKIRLRLTLMHSGLQENTKPEIVVQTSYKRYDRVVKDGETVRLRFGKSADHDTWLELRVQEDK
jgi:hypothetical protein